MGIEADFYSLKHTNTTETLDILNEKFAEGFADKTMMAQTGHKSPVIMIGSYDVNRKQRQHKQLIQIDNSFG